MSNGANIISDNMVNVEGGEFDMGDIWGCGGSDEKPVNTVKVNDFCINKYLITYEQFIEFLNSITAIDTGYFQGQKLIDLEDTHCAINNDGLRFIFTSNSKAPTMNCPVTGIHWPGAIQFCNWLSEKEGREKVYSNCKSSIECDFTANGYRLPTEAEWEYAARSKGRNDQKWSGANNRVSLEDYCWYHLNSKCRTHAVGSTQPNPLGIYDMSGNVWEWCWDWYDGNYYSNSPKNNPTGPSNACYRILRGGHFSENAYNCRTSFREYDFPTLNNEIRVGFRICRSK